MTYNDRTIESMNNDLHTVSKSKDTEITIEPENQADKKKSKLLSLAICYLTAFPKKVH